MIKTVIFDVGGVLQWHDGARLLNDICDYFDVSHEDAGRAWGSLLPLLGRGKLDEHEFWQRFTRRLGVSKPLPEESMLVRGLRETFKANEGMPPYLAQLRERGLQLAVLSNTIKPHADFLRSQQIYDGFDAVILSHEVGMRKPDREIYEYTLERLGAGAQEALLVDDDAGNVEAARAMGMAGIVYGSLEELKAELASRLAE